MTNSDFLKVISDSFNAFIQSGTSRSTDKLKPLHGAIAKDIATRLGDEYTVFSQGYRNGKEHSIMGRYFIKMVDISVFKGEKPVVGISVKFVMQNYSQNSNNYFENMLGETANIRSGHCPYFQVFIVLDKLPYYKKNGDLSKWETFTEHNINKYVTLSKDDTGFFFHTPNKTLIYVVHVPDNDGIKNKDEYMKFYGSRDVQVKLTSNHYEDFDAAVILNDYETFISKVYYTIMSL